LRKAIVFIAAMCSILLPWVVRNAITFHAFIPFSTGSGRVLWGANNPVVFSRWGYGWISPSDLPYRDKFEGLGEVEADRTLNMLALDYLQRVPFSVLLQAELAKISSFIGAYNAQVKDNFPLLLLALAALWRLVH
jgi:hypothetical protein